VCGGGERLVQGFGGGNLRERDYLGDSGIDGRIILRWIFRKWSKNRVELYIYSP
jgi:hypothetical protein